MDILKNKKVLIGAAAAVVVLIVLIVLLSNAYKAPLNNLIDITYKAKFNKLEKMAPKEYWDWYEEKYDTTVDELIEEANENKDDYLELLEKKYGDNIKVTSKVTDKNELSKKKLEKIAEALNEKYDIKESSVKKAYEVEYELTIKGSEDEDEEEGEITVVKIGMNWYAIYVYEMGDEVSVGFVTGA